MTDRATKLNSYYENLRTNVMSILGQVREPIIPPPPSGPNSAGSTSTSAGGIGGSGGPGGISGVVAANSQDQFDSYLTKLQTICSENGDHHASKSPYCGTATGAVVAPKTALQAYNSSAKL